MASKKLGAELEALKKEAQLEREACKQHFRNGGRETMKQRLKTSTGKFAHPDDSPGTSEESPER